MRHYEVWRQDDHGNKFLVRAHAGELAAQAQADELTRRGHKQTYWVQPGDCKGPACACNRN